MIEFGKALRQAREAKGYTIAQVAEMTRMAPKTVTDLENENFSHIAAPIYGRGFVKLYCEALGLEAKPFVDEFMAIYSGEKDVGIRERTLLETPAPEPEPPVAEPAVLILLLLICCAYLVDGFQVSGLLYAVLTAILINIISAVVGR